MVLNVNEIEIPLDKLLEHFQSRGIQSQNRLAAILRKDSGDMSRFFTGKARKTYADTIRKDIRRMFGVVITDYPSEE